MVRKRSSRNTNNSQDISSPKKRKIQDGKISNNEDPSTRDKIKKQSSSSEIKHMTKNQPRRKECKTNASNLKEHRASPSKLQKHEQDKTQIKSKERTGTRQSDMNISKKRKASRSNPIQKHKTKKQKEDINNISKSVLPKKHNVSSKLSSPIKDFHSKKNKPLQEDLDLTRETKEENKDSSGEESEVEWEDVQEAEGHHDNIEPASTTSTTLKSEDKNVEISIEIPGMKGKKRKKVQEDLLTKIKKAMAKFQKEIQLEKHKVHLLLLISVGLHRNAICNQLNLQAFFLSTIPVQYVNKSVNKWKSGDLIEFFAWFKEEFPSLQKLNFTLLKYEVVSAGSLPKCLAEVLLAFLRSLGFLARLVFSVQPVPMKTGQSKNSKRPSPKNNKTIRQKGKTQTSLYSSKQASSDENPTSPYFQTDAKGKIVKTPTRGEAKNIPENSLKAKSTKQPISKKTARKLRKKKKVNYFVNGTSGSLSDEESEYEEETEITSSDEEEHFERQKKFNLKTPTSKSSRQKKSISSKSSESPSVVDLLDDDDDFEVTSKPVISGKTVFGTPDQPVRILSDDSDSDKDISFTYSQDFWVEVYLPSMKCWSCIDMTSYSIDKPELCEENARQPLTYVLGFDNANKIKDITGRYATDWLSKTQKMRIDADWWEETLLPFKTKKKKLDETEDALLLEKYQEKPLPQSITEYKNHPLYVLKRHLLKFEAIYPETAATLGFIRGEAVYSRDCLHLLHTREKWMSLEARVVKQGEEPYKIVKGRVKRNQLNVDPNSVTIDLFGRWQTEDYKPPPAKDGKVPRNEYGNVELFKPSMLPPGTKHIQVPGIQKIAKKLGIDGAPAVVGFDFHCGFCHPIIDGLVVCKEYVPTLMDAWRQEQEEARRRKEEKREKRVLGNWKLLVKSMLIRERLKKKYTLENKESTLTSSKHGEVLEEEMVTEAVAWPQNMKEGKTSVADKGHCHVFPKKLHKKDKLTGEWTKACSCGFTQPLN